MDKEVENMKTKTVIPYVRINQLIEFVASMPTNEISLNDLVIHCGIRRSQIKNIIPSLIALKLLEKTRDKVKLTDIGQNLRVNIKTNNEEKCKEIFKHIIPRVEPLSFVVELLNKEQKLTIDQIGKELAVKFKKSWDHPLTYRTYGASCASIVAFAGYGVYDGGVLRKSGLLSVPIKVPFPNVTFQKIIKILENIYPCPDISLKELSQKIKTSEGRLASELIVCNELKLVRREYRGTYRISALGDKLINPSLSQKEKAEIFKMCLLNSRYRIIIEKLSNITFDATKLGEIILYTFRSTSTTKTQKVYGMKFLNWLKYAQIVKKVRNGEYTLTLENSQLQIKKQETPIEELEEKKERNLSENEETKNTLNYHYYEIGKLIGMILACIEKKDFSIQEIDKLISKCNYFEGTEEVITLLTEHKELFGSLNDPRIFLADIKFLEKKIGGENEKI